MVNKTKKGFTIVELVIVIAVIAILAAVLIPTFSNLINKANESADTMLVKNLNTALSVDVEKHTTMSAALEKALFNGGYDVATITTKNKGTKILWDSKNDCFVYVDKNGKVQYIPESTKGAGFEKAKDWELFEICKTMPENLANQKYSIYLLDNEYAQPVEVNGIGFDAGNNVNIPKVTYERASGDTRDIVLYTNSVSTTVEVNAPSDNVTHYGVAGNVSILAVKGSSYHEAGKIIGTLTVESGHVQVESGAEVASIIAATKSQGNTATTAPTVTASNGATVGTVVVNDASAVITVQSGATVAEVAPGTGVTLDTTKVTGITPSETAIDTANASKFAGGLGTEASPYLIANAEQLFNIGDFANIITNFKLINDITVTSNAIGEKDFISDSFVGTLDGDNHSITFVDNIIFFAKYSGLQITASGNYITPTYYQNLTIYNKTGEAGVAIVYQSYYSYFKNVNFGDPSVSSEYELNHTTNNQGGYIAFCWNYGIFENCTNYYNHVSSMEDVGISPFIAGYGDNNSTTKGSKTSVQFINCVNYGTITGAHVGLFVANDQLMDNWKMFKVVNCANYGSLIGYKTSGIVGRASSNVYKNSNDYAVTGLASTVKIVKDATLALATNEDGYLVITKATSVSTVYYSISYTVYAAHYEKNAEGEFVKNGSSKVTVQINLSDLEFVENKATTTLKKYNVMDYNTYTTTYGELSDASWNSCTAAIGPATYAIDTVNSIIVVKVDAGESDYITVNTKASTAVSIFGSEDSLLGIAIAK